MIARDRYLQQLIAKKENGLIKVITGIMRCGKSFLLFEIYHRYLNSIGVDDAHIIELALDDDENMRYRNPIELGAYIRSLLMDKDKTYYIFLDEIQKVKEIKNPYLDAEDEKVGFVDVLLAPPSSNAWRKGGRFMGRCLSARAVRVLSCGACILWGAA